MNSSHGPIGIHYQLVLCCAFLVSISYLECAAQNRQSPARKDVLPRVGTIKDYPATGLMTGCGNLYFYPASHTTSTDADYIFLAHGDGSNAWMNLDGRDVRLHQLKRPRRDSSPHRYYYRSGKLQVSVIIEDFKPATAATHEGDSMYRMRITLRQGKAVRTVNAVGDSDC